MRRYRSTWIALLLSACAHESNRPTALGPERSSSSHARHSAQSYPEPARDDSALAAQFQSAPALATLEGEASYYGSSLAGHPTASGEPYRPLAFTAAHRRLPFGTVLRVTRQDGARTVYVRVNDRGPYGSSRRILDLSHAAAEQLGMLRAGVLEVRAEVVAYGEKRGR